MMLDEARTSRWFGAAAVALFVGVPLLVATLTIGNLARWSEAAALTDETNDRIAQIEIRIRAQAARRESARGDTATLFLSAATGSLARAELQQRLVGLVERAGGRLIEVRGDEAPEGSPTLSILMRLSLDIGNEGLFDLLAAIETGLPILTVEALNARPAAGRTAGSEEANPTLRVALAIRAYQRGETP